MAAEAGQLQLNVFEPLIAYRLLAGLGAMINACTVLRERCVNGITANPDRMRRFVEHSIGIVTALVPVIGYETSTEIARDALASGRGVYELVMERGLLTREQLDRALNPEAMTAPRAVDSPQPAPRAVDPAQPAPRAVDPAPAARPARPIKS
jgi:aspartate ammonia-lyase